MTSIAQQKYLHVLDTAAEDDVVFFTEITEDNSELRSVRFLVDVAFPHQPVRQL